VVHDTSHELGTRDDMNALVALVEIVYVFWPFQSNSSNLCPSCPCTIFGEIETYAVGVFPQFHKINTFSEIADSHAGRNAVVRKLLVCEKDGCI